MHAKSRLEYKFAFASCPITEQQTRCCALTSFTPPRPSLVQRVRTHSLQAQYTWEIGLALADPVYPMRFLQGAGVACLALATLFAVQCVAKDAAFFEDFGSGWDSRWVQSKDDKYNGKFAAESPKNLDDQALKVTQQHLQTQTMVGSQCARATYPLF